jgi:hypothetical protein
VSAAQQLALSLTAADQDRVLRVLRLIEQREGSRSAIRIADIAARTEVPYRDVQEIKKFLVEERQKAIGTLWKRPYGYYMIAAEAELERNFYQFGRRGISNLKHMRAYATPALRAAIVGQLDLFVTAALPLIDELGLRLGER